MKGKELEEFKERVEDYREIIYYTEDTSDTVINAIYEAMTK